MNIIREHFANGLDLNEKIYTEDDLDKEEEIRKLMNIIDIITNNYAGRINNRKI